MSCCLAESQKSSDPCLRRNRQLNGYVASGRQLIHELRAKERRLRERQGAALRRGSTRFRIRWFVGSSCKGKDGLPLLTKLPNLGVLRFLTPGMWMMGQECLFGTTIRGGPSSSCRPRTCRCQVRLGSCQCKRKIFGCFQVGRTSEPSTGL